MIVQEIGAAQDTPDDVVFEHLNELCFPDQPMGRSLLGTAKTLKRLDRDMLRGYLSTHYRGPDMVVAAAVLRMEHHSGWSRTWPRASPH